MPLAGTEGGISPFFSPDGRWIGYVTVDGKLRKVPVDGGNSLTISEDANQGYASAAWLDDGTIVYVGGQKRSLMGIPADGSYGIEPGIVYSHPVRCNSGNYEIVQDLAISEFSRERMAATEVELREERSAIEELL